MNIHVCEPGGVGNEITTAMVLFNHVGSTVAQDTGRDAKFLANELGVVTVAVDRPGTAGLIPSVAQANKLSSHVDYVTEMYRIGRTVERQLGRIGLERTMVVGRSAGALAALALTVTETISDQAGVFAAEPVGCEKMPVIIGRHRYSAYKRVQKWMQESNEALVAPYKDDELSLLKQLARAGTMVPNFLYDKFHNKNIWASDAAMRYAKYIAAAQPKMETVIEFAEYSLGVTEETYKSFRDLELLRTYPEAEFSVRRVPNTTHASYDNRKFMANRLMPLISRLERR